MTLPITPSQTIGPFSHEAWQWATSASSVAAPAGPAITVAGVIRDGAGAPIDDAMIEFCLPGQEAAEQGNALPGFRRMPSDAEGGFSARLPAPAPGQPAAYVTVFARGLLVHAFSAVFLADDPELAQSAILEQVPAERRPTLLATPAGPGHYRWDIHMQGEHETVFFDYA
jgi:protocatechuate 3,4-dioxygenase alpha subunit